MTDRLARAVATHRWWQCARVTGDIQFLFALNSVMLYLVLHREELMNNPKPLRDVFPWTAENAPQMPKFSRHSGSEPFEFPPVSEDVPAIDLHHTVPDLGLELDVFTGQGGLSDELWTRVTTHRPELQGATVKVCLRGSHDEFVYTRVVLDPSADKSVWQGSALIGRIADLFEQLGSTFQLDAFIL